MPSQRTSQDTKRRIGDRDFASEVERIRAFSHEFRRLRAQQTAQAAAQRAGAEAKGLLAWADWIASTVLECELTGARFDFYECHEQLCSLLRPPLPLPPPLPPSPSPSFSPLPSRPGSQQKGDAPAAQAAQSAQSESSEPERELQQQQPGLPLGLPPLHQSEVTADPKSELVRLARNIVLGPLFLPFPKQPQRLEWAMANLTEAAGAEKELKKFFLQQGFKNTVGKAYLVHKSGDDCAQQQPTQQGHFHPYLA